LALHFTKKHNNIGLFKVVDENSDGAKQDDRKIEGEAITNHH
jgi:hypothetical protein